MTNATLSDQLHDMWRTRPVRLPDKGPVAGVAAGVGYRYGVDPVLIRVAFVVSAIFGGAGFIFYLAGWLFLSRAGDESSAAESLFGKGRSSDSNTKAIVLLVALAIAITTMGPIGVGLGGSGLISAALLAGGLWLLHQRQPLPPPLPTGTSDWSAPVLGFPTPPFTTTRFGSPPPPAADVYSPYTKLPDHYVPDSASPTADTPTNDAVGQTDTADDTTPKSGPSLVKTSDNPTPTVTTAFPGIDLPPSWDPLGVAPFAWDLPEPTPPAAAVMTLPRKRSRFTSTVLGVAILAAAGTGAAAVAGADWLTPGRIGAVALAVIGLGLIIGAFVRRGYGLLVVTGPLVGFVVLASLIGPIEFDETTMGDHDWRPTTVADLQSEYAVLLGSGELDLRSLELTRDATVTIDAQLAEIKVILPENMNVRKNSTIFAGETTGLPDGLDGGADGTDGPTLTLNVNTRLASVEVVRG